MRRARIFALTASVLIFVALVLGCATRIDFVIEKRVEDNRGPSPTRVEIGIDIRDLLLSQVSELHEFESGIQSAADDAVGEQVGSLLGTRFVWSIPLSFIPYFNVSLNLVMGNDPNEAEQYLADLQNESRYGRTIRRGAQEDEFQMALAKAAAGDTAIAVLKDWYQDAKSPGGVLNVANEDKL
ncbi:hypothetical protein J7M28_12590, partial [bacterium]|nr:hypothetical protein [bacterium]